MSMSSGQRRGGWGPRLKKTTSFSFSSTSSRQREGRGSGEFLPVLADLRALFAARQFGGEAVALGCCRACTVYGTCMTEGTRTTGNDGRPTSTESPADLFPIRKRD